MAANRHSLPSACRVPRLRRPLPRLGGHKVPATAHRPLVHAPRTIQASSRFTDGGPRARDSGSGPESAPGNRLPRRRPRGITGYAPHDSRPEPWRLPPAVASEAGVQPQGALGAPTDGSSKSRRGPPPGPHGGTDSSPAPDAATATLRWALARLPAPLHRRARRGLHSAASPPAASSNDGRPCRAAPPDATRAPAPPPTGRDGPGRTGEHTHAPDPAGAALGKGDPR